jgi:putative transcriptional regulator
MTTSLTGRLLVATPALVDPNFVRTVVLVLEHGDDGAVGVVLNRPSELEVDDVLPGWGPHVTKPAVLFQGGPVGLDGALAVGQVTGDAEGVPGFRPFGVGLGLVDLDTPTELVSGALGSLRVFAGYSGWGDDQLDTELEEGAWYVVDAEPDDVFGADVEELWRAVLRRQGGDLALVSTWTIDPELN